MRIPMRVPLPKENIKTFDYTYEFQRNIFLLYEFLVIFDNSLNLEDINVEKKLKDFIKYLSSIIYPLPPSRYDLIDEKFYITDTYEDYHK